VSDSKWGQRAAALYQPEYATRYREADDQIAQGELVQTFGQWLRELTVSFGRDISVLDLGCGTGRYFWALANVRELVGIDVSAPMLERARNPVNPGSITARHISLLQGDFFSHAFDAGQFDLVYSIGVLAEHSPLDDGIVARVARWLAPGGLFAFTAVHPQSFSVTRTWRRRLAEWALPVTAGAVRAALRERLMAGGLYADETRLRELLPRHGFAIESLRPHRSDIHLHLMCVARKAADGAEGGTA
jgi:SAM-dependent methyltransferase